jgi:hypothetical protein
MKCVIDRHVVLSQPPQGPIAVHVEAFATSLREQGYARYSITRHVHSQPGSATGLDSRESLSAASPTRMASSIYEPALSGCS